MPIDNTEKLILIVDDSKDIRDVYAHGLKRKGFRVAVARDGQEALHEAIELQPDLILMDLMLPGIGGWAVTQRLKKRMETKDIPIIIITAHSSEGTEAVIKEGCEGFLIKPCFSEDLLTEVNRVLRGRLTKSNPAREIPA